MARTFRWPKLLDERESGQRESIIFGGDYNPDQWPESVWDEDVALMRRAGVNTVALAIFSWAKIQPAEDKWDFEWLDCIINKLGKAGIAVDLASATANAPMWLYIKHPEVLPQDKYGHVVHPGSRQSWRPTSPIFREYALTLCRKLAERYGENPYVTSWHIGNEYGWNNREDYSEDALHAFRKWCQSKYGTIDALNEAWGTAFWGQSLRSFDEVLLPYFMGADSMVNPAQKLDFERFGNDALLDFYKAERDVIASLSPDKPCTTNFMVSTDQCAMDYDEWADEVDFVSNDHYFQEGAHHLDELSCSDSLMASLAEGRAWYVMEHSTSAVQWKPLNVRKTHGELIRDALAHVAFGADAINFFQWRASRSGAEAFHSAMLPHAGSETKVFKDVCQLGQILSELSQAGVCGSTVRRSNTAVLFSAESEWATRCETLPTRQLNHWHDVRDWYYAFLNAGHRADVVPLRDDWSEYDTIIVPTMIMLSDADVSRLCDFAENGGRVIVGYATGLVDENFHVGLGGYPGAGQGKLRELLGVRGEEFNILGDADCQASINLSNGGKTHLWQNDITVTHPAVEVLAWYDGSEAEAWELDGKPAITRRKDAYFVGCDLSVEAISNFVSTYLTPCPTHRDSRVIHTVRQSETAFFDFYLSRDVRDIDDGDIDVSDMKDKGINDSGTNDGKTTIDIHDGTVVYAYRAKHTEGSITYTLSRNGVLIVKRESGL